MKFEEHEIEWTEEKVSRLWNYYQQAPSISDNYFGAHNGKHITHLINDKIKFAKLRKILDLSCGPGDIINACFPYLKNGQQVYGTDFSKYSVDSINTRFKDVKEFQGASFINRFPTSFPDSEFDLIISTEVVEHLNDDEIEPMLKETHRLLSSKGYIFITTPNNEDRDANKVMCPECGCKFHRWQHLRSWTAESLRTRVEQYGFQTKLVTPIAWGETPFKRFAYNLAAKISMKIETGLVYIGQKLP